MNKIISTVIIAFCAVSLSYGMNVNQELVEATHDRNTDLMQEAIKRGADVNFKRNDIRGNPIIALLPEATMMSFHEGMRLLIENGADVNVQGGRGLTPLMLARDVEAANILIQAGANVNQKDQESNTSLHHAIRHNNIDIVRLLLENGADIKTSNNRRQTPYTLAVESKNKEIQKLIADHAQESQRKYVESIAEQSRKRR